MGTHFSFCIYLSWKALCSSLTYAMLQISLVQFHGVACQLCYSVFRHTNSATVLINGSLGAFPADAIMDLIPEEDLLFHLGTLPGMCAHQFVLGS